MASDPASCPLDDRTQTRNLILYSVNTGLIYLASPVIYVGVVHAPICKELGADGTVANLPGSVYFAAAFVPILVAWYFPYIAALRRIVIGCFAITAVMFAITAGILLVRVPDWVKITTLILQAAVTGGAALSGINGMWEVLGRGVAVSRRGLALSLAFGVGPILAVLGSLGSQLLLKGEVAGVKLTPMTPPWNYAALFAAAVPVMALAAVLANWFVVPAPEREVTRQPFLEGVFGGLGDFLADRRLRTIALAAVLVYAASRIDSNLSLYTQEVLGGQATDFAGYSNAFRFGLKCIAGVLLGWLLTRTHPRAGVTLTTLLAALGLVWAMASSGWWFLISFGLFGAGELFGVYTPNYILTCSAPARMRRNMAFASMLLVPAAPAGALFGRISDWFGDSYSRAFGFQVSFGVALALLAVAFVLIQTLPARPRPEAGSEGQGPFTENQGVRAPADTDPP